MRKILARIFGAAAPVPKPAVAPGGLTVSVGFAPWSPNPAPPKASETVVSDAVKSWAETWGAIIANHECPSGWTLCKFGVRGNSEQEASEVWGIVRDGFGVYKCRFWLMLEGAPGRDGFLAVGVNARTGYAFGVFVEIEHAVGAAEIAARLSNREETLDRGAFQRLGAALTEVGYGPSNLYCRPMRGEEIKPGVPWPVWARVPQQARPEEIKPS